MDGGTDLKFQLLFMSWGATLELNSPDTENPRRVVVGGLKNVEGRDVEGGGI